MTRARQPPEHPPAAQYAGRRHRAPARVSAWAVAVSGTAAARMAIARDPQSTAEDLAAVAPRYPDAAPDLELVAAVLDHPAVPAGVVARFVTCADPSIRLRVVQHRQCGGAALAVLAHDRAPEIRALA